MGANQSGRGVERSSVDEEVNFDHFQILRAIGKGSFGKVCIVQKKDCKRMFAMKYMNKSQCVERDALKNVLREVEILTTLEHPFLVNLWFSFQDEEDLFMVSDLLLGGDLRYHVQQEVTFSEDCVKLYVCELSLALDYLQSKRIVHRDIKPDNILLDEEGHAHITDFNIATVLENGQLATSMSGTKPYMAPEIFECAADECVGYGFPVDWWSLGVVAYEMFYGARPFDIHSATSVSEVRSLFTAGAVYPSTSRASHGFVDLIDRLLCVRPGGRISSLEELRKVHCLHDINLDAVLEKHVKPSFTPPKDHLNCDPTFELEEMIVETRPLHKKKKRLAKQRSLREIQGSPSADLDGSGDMMSERYIQHLPQFRVYNREQELVRREREQKETAWEQELLQAMRDSDPTGTQQAKNEDQKPKNSSSSDSANRTDLMLRNQRSADSVNVTINQNEKTEQQETKNREQVNKTPTKVDQNIKSDVVGNFMKRDYTERRHSDHTYKGIGTTQASSLVRNTISKSLSTTCEDPLSKDGQQQKHGVISIKHFKGLGSSIAEPNHCRSCPKLNNTNEQTKSSPKMFCGRSICKENVECIDKQNNCSMSKNMQSVDKFQMKDMDRTYKSSDQCQSFDNHHQNQSMIISKTQNSLYQISEEKKIIQDQCIVKEHGSQINIGDNKSVDYHFQKVAKADYSKPGSSSEDQLNLT